MALILIIRKYDIKLFLIYVNPHCHHYSRLDFLVEIYRVPTIERKKERNFFSIRCPNSNLSRQLYIQTNDASLTHVRIVLFQC